MNQEINQNINNNFPVPNGVLVIVGGHENKGEIPEKKVQQGEYKPLEILREFVKLINDKEGIIEVITSGSEEGDESFEDYRKAFTELEVANIGHIHHDKRGDVLHDDEALSRIKKANGVFFSGGDQLKLTSIYGGTEILLQLKQRYIYDQIILGGTSAGAMAMSTPMIYACNKEKQQITGEVKITTGLEFLKDVCIDTHFVDRGRFVRMAQVVATNPTSIGLGIEEDTAIIVSNGLDCRVIGSGVVIVIEGFNITDSNVVKFGPDERIFIHDLNVKLLARDSYYRIPMKNPPHI